MAQRKFHSIVRRFRLRIPKTPVLKKSVPGIHESKTKTSHAVWVRGKALLALLSITVALANHGCLWALVWGRGKIVHSSQCVALSCAAACLNASANRILQDLACSMLECRIARVVIVLLLQFMPRAASVKQWNTNYGDVDIRATDNPLLVASVCVCVCHSGPKIIYLCSSNYGLSFGLCHRAYHLSNCFGLWVRQCAPRHTHAK